MKGKIKTKLIKTLCMTLIGMGLGGQMLAATTSSVNEKSQMEWEANGRTNILLDHESLESFSDEFMKDYMQKYKIPGGAVAIVANGEVVFEKGYGYSQLEKKKKFDLQDTSFSIASITKTFTAMSVMKLVEEGKVDLKENILTYLPELKIDNPYEEPVTVEELLTHTGGVDSSYTKDLSYTEVDNNESHHLLKLLNTKGIHIVSKPGEFIEYSSYGTVILGAIVEEVSGQSCEAYIEQNILKPLGMNSTHMLNPEVVETNGYLFNGKAVEEAKMKGFFRFYPEGGLVSTVSDMTHYVGMLLNEGCYLEKEILSLDTLQEAFKEHAKFDAYLPGMGYGFANYEDEGIHSVGHAGYAIDGTLSEIAIYPEQNVGTFIVVNQGSNNNFQADFRKAFVSKFLKNSAGKQNDLEEQGVNDNLSTNMEVEGGKKQDTSLVTRIDPKGLEGTYRFSDYPKTNLYKANTFGAGEINIRALDEQTIELDGKDEFTFKSYKKKATWIKENTYKVEDEMSYLAFKKDESGKICMAATENSNHGIYEKLGWYEKASIQVPFFIGALGVFGVQLLVAVILGIRNKLRRDKKVSGSSWINRTTNSIALLHIGFFTYSMFCWGDRLRYTVSWDIYLNLAMPIAALILTIVLGGMVIREIARVNKEKKSAMTYVYHIGMLIFYSIFACFLNYWNFIGYKL